MDSKDYMTRQEAAVVLRTSAQTIDKRIREGQLAAVRVGRRVLIPLMSMEAYLARCQAGNGWTKPAANDKEDRT